MKTKSVAKGSLAIFLSSRQWDAQMQMQTWEFKGFRSVGLIVILLTVYLEKEEIITQALPRPYIPWDNGLSQLHLLQWNTFIIPLLTAKVPPQSLQRSIIIFSNNKINHIATALNFSGTVSSAAYHPHKTVLHWNSPIPGNTSETLSGKKTTEGQMRVIKFKYFPFLSLNPFARQDVKYTMQLCMTLHNIVIKNLPHTPPAYVEVIPTNSVNDSS